MTGAGHGAAVRRRRLRALARGAGELRRSALLDRRRSSSSWCWRSWSAARPARSARPGATSRRPPAPWSGSTRSSSARPPSHAPAEPKPLPVPPRGEIAFEDVSFAYPGPPRPAGADRLQPARPARRARRAGRPLRRRQEHGLPPAAALLRPARRASCGWTAWTSREADPAEVRARIALVAQDAPLFSGSALDNLRFGREGASRRRAARRRQGRRGRGLHRGAAARASTPRWASAPRPSPAASASAWPSPAPWSAARRSCCSTRPPAPSTPRASGWCSARSPTPCRAAPRW